MATSRENILIPNKNTILENTFTEAIQTNLNSVQKWTSWKEDHEGLKKTLKDLPNKLSHPGVIPFGSRALIKANIVHTNEILSCVGDGYFIKQSAKQAIDMCDRRIKDSEKMLEDLAKERDLIKSNQTLPKMEEAFPSEEQDEIIEEYDEEKEAEWRVRHREMEKKYRSELADLKKRREVEGPPQTESDLFRRLDMLELEEELNDELERLNDETDSDEPNEESGEETTSEEEVEKQDSQEKDAKKYHNPQFCTSSSENLLDIDNNETSFGGYHIVPKNSHSLEPGHISYGFTDQEGNDWQKSALMNSHKENPVVSASQKSRKSVSFASDEDEPDTENSQEIDSNIYIRFKHSDNKFHEPPANQTTESGDIILINSPKDIYKQYARFMASSEPKSILKKNSSCEGDTSTCEDIASVRPFGYSHGLRCQDGGDDQAAPQPACELPHPPPVLRDVLETNSSEPSASQSRPVEASRPVSRFKASRAASRK